MSATWTPKMRKMALLHYIKYGTSLRKEMRHFIFNDFETEFVKNGGRPGSSVASFNFKTRNFQALDKTSDKPGMEHYDINDESIFNKYFDNYDLLLKDLTVNTQKTDRKRRKKLAKRNPDLLDEVGRKGEEFFNNNKSSSTFSDVMELLSGSKPEEFIWVNKEHETGESFDFESSSYKIDVKTSISGSDDFYISEAELKRVNNNELYILKIWMSKSYEYIKHRIFTPLEVKQKFNIKATQYVAKFIK